MNNSTNADSLSDSENEKLLDQKMKFMIDCHNDNQAVCDTKIMSITLSLDEMEKEGVLSQSIRDSYNAQINYYLQLKLQQEAKYKDDADKLLDDASKLYDVTVNNMLGDAEKLAINANDYFKGLIGILTLISTGALAGISTFLFHHDTSPLNEEIARHLYNLALKFGILLMFCVFSWISSSIIANFMVLAMNKMVTKVKYNPSDGDIQEVSKIASSYQKVSISFSVISFAVVIIIIIAVFVDVTKVYFKMAPYFVQDEYITVPQSDYLG